MQPTLLILAAGMGSRYGGLKQMDRVGPSGETIIDYSIYDALRAGFGKMIFVIREEIESDFREVFLKKLEGKVEIDYVFQDLKMIPEGFLVPGNREKPWGTGHAVWVSREKVKEPFAVINADDYYGPRSYQVMEKFLSDHRGAADYSMVGFQLDKTLSDFGKVARGVCETNQEGYLTGITERTNIEKTNEGILFMGEQGKPVYLKGDEVVSMNFWGFQPSVFDYLDRYFTEFLNEHAVEPKAEFFIPVPVMKLIRSAEANVKVLQSGESWFGVTYREDKASVIKKIREKVDAGIYPENLWK